jgi:hypothetical protein
LTVRADAAISADLGGGAIGDVAVVGGGARCGEVGDGLKSEEVQGGGEGEGRVEEEEEGGKDEEEGIVEVHRG